MRLALSVRASHSTPAAVVIITIIISIAKRETDTIDAFNHMSTKRVWIAYCCGVIALKPLRACFALLVQAVVVIRATITIFIDANCIIIALVIGV